MRHGASVSAPWVGYSASWMGRSLGSLRGRSVSAMPSLALLGPPPKPPPPVLLASLSCRCLAVLLRGLELTRRCLLGLGGRPHPELPIMADGKGNGHMGSLHGLPPSLRARREEKGQPRRQVTDATACKRAPRAPNGRAAFISGTCGGNASWIMQHTSLPHPELTSAFRGDLASRRNETPCLECLALPSSVSESPYRLKAPPYVGIPLE